MIISLKYIYVVDNSLVLLGTGYHLFFRITTSSPIDSASYLVPLEALKQFFGFVPREPSPVRCNCSIKPVYYSLLLVHVIHVGVNSSNYAIHFLRIGSIYGLGYGNHIGGVMVSMPKL